MGFFNILKNKNNNSSEKNDNALIVESQDNSIIETSNYILVDAKKKEIALSNSIKMPITSLTSLGKEAALLEPSIKNALNTDVLGNSKLFEITNLKPGDTLKTTKSGTTYGIVNKAGESSKLAQLKEINVPIDPTMMMMAVVLYKIEGELKEISELSKKIYSFLVQDKEAEIEADLETLNNVIREYKYNCTDKQYLANNHKYVMDIKRTAKKNMNFYKKQITDDILQNKLIVINQNINSVLEELEKKFKYYRLSLYTYSFSSFLEMLLLGNYQVDYLITKKEELEALDNEYTNNYEMASKFIQNIANKSLEGNLLKGIGSASKTMGNLASKVSIMKDKDIDKWLTDKGENLSKSSNDMKDTFIIKFEKVKESKSKIFIDKIENVNTIYNKTKSIYFDNNYIYLSNGNDK